ncbi:hypothetical protein D049_1228A, partial [Vibrio parahaemolyticus VPTS-2010]
MIGTGDIINRDIGFPATGDEFQRRSC